MNDKRKANLTIWIKKLHNICMELNASLISFYKLDEYNVLSTYDNFVLPAAAVLHKIIPRQGVFKYKDNVANYHVHGGGITFLVENVKVSFGYFPQLSSNIKPILGLSRIFDFISSSAPNDDLYDQQFIENNLLILFQDNILTRLYEDYLEFYLNTD